MLMNNCGEHIHRQVIEVGLLPLLVKIVKKKVFNASLNLQLPMINWKLLFIYFSNLFGSFDKFLFYFTVRSASSGENIFPPRCHTDISWWSFWKVSSIPCCILWLGGKSKCLTCWPCNYIGILCSLQILCRYQSKGYSYFFFDNGIVAKLTKKVFKRKSIQAIWGGLWKLSKKAAMMELIINMVT